MNWTFERAHQLHRELWHWLAMNPGELKHDWPRWKSRGGPVSDCLFHHCFACYVACFCPPFWDCSVCPIHWGDGQPCYITGGQFAHWETSGKDSDLIHWAKIIRDMPWHRHPGQLTD